MGVVVEILTSGSADAPTCPNEYHGVGNFTHSDWNKKKCSQIAGAEKF